MNGPADVPGLGLAESAKVSVILSDHASADAAGKINALGLGWQITGLQPNGLTPPQTIIVLVDLPQKFAGEEVALSLSLVDESDEPVTVPGPGGDVRPLRIQQLARVDRPVVPLGSLPSTVPCRIQLIMNMPNGVRVDAGQHYRWRVEIDGNKRPEWDAAFYVAKPPSGPVLG